MSAGTTDRADVQDRATDTFFAVTLSAAALSLAAGLYAWHRSRKATVAPEHTPQTNEAARNTRKVLQYFIIPLWTAAGIADWFCHRASKIERTTGLKETALHLMMPLSISSFSCAEVGVFFCHRRPPSLRQRRPRRFAPFTGTSTTAPC